MKKYILFDLDGTLTDSGEGIINSVIYALDKFGIKADPKSLKPFIGPPLRDSFMKYYGFTREDAEKAVGIYRERFVPVGIYENRLYDGVSDMLKNLKKEGAVLILATSKPETMAYTVTDYFKITQFFDFIKGADLAGTFENKGEIIEAVLNEAKVSDKKDAVMVGDTEFDIEGAKKAGIRCIAVNYGYGDLGSLKNADFIVNSVGELEKKLMDF